MNKTVIMGSYKTVEIGGRVRLTRPRAKRVTANDTRVVRVPASERTLVMISPVLLGFGYKVR